MDKELSGPELRKLVKELMLKKLIKEDDDDELGIYGGGFDTYEFDNDAMRAAMADIKADGQEFEPLGKSKFEKNLDIDGMKNDLSMDNLNLPKEKEKTRQIQQNLDKRYKHEKQFGVGSLNENDFEKPIKNTGGLTATDPIFHQLQELKLNPIYTPWGTIDIDVDGLHGSTTISFHKITMKAGEETKLYGANLVFENMFDGPPDVEKNAFIGNLFDAVDFVKKEKEKSEKELANIPTINATSAEPHVGPRVVGKMDLPTDNKKRFKENDESKNFTDFDMTNLYKFLKDAMYYIESNGFDYAEGAHLLEKALIEKFNVTKKSAPVQNFSLNENPNVNPKSKINRPKDAEGSDITNGARVEDLDTGTVGRVLHPGIDENGNLTIHVDWVYNFGDAIVKPVVYPNKIVVRDDNRIVREEEIEEGMGQSHTVGKGENIKPGNYPQTLKRVGLKENLDQAVHTTDDEVFFVVDNDFNRAHYKDLIGKTFDDAPGYAQVKLVKRNTTGIPEDSVEAAFHRATEVPKTEMENETFDYAAAEREQSGQQELNALSSEAEQQVPEDLIKFMVPDSFNSTDADEDGRYEMNFILKIPKQSDETVKDVERFIKEYIPTDIGGPGQSYQKTNLYTELEKGTNKWIINVNVSKGYNI